MAEIDSKPIVFIHTNEKQFIGAKVAEYALKKFSANKDLFEIRIIQLNDYPQLKRREGKSYLRNGLPVKWRNADLQSFTLLRFLPPQLMGYWGRALVIDPDVFACADVMELLRRPMEGRAILARRHPSGGFASSVMLLDCSKLTHWRWDREIDELFSFQRDYRDWLSLNGEAPGTIGELEETWNHYDTLDGNTRMLHNTQRLTQPWKTGLRIDFSYDPPKADSHKWGIIPRSFIQRVKHLRRNSKQSFYQPHPDPLQEQFFLSLLREALETETLSPADLRRAVSQKNVRGDIFSVLGNTNSL